MRKTILLLSSMAAGVLLAGGVASAAAGDLDRSFGGDGKVLTAFYGGDAGVSSSDALLQPNGRIVVVGGVAPPLPTLLRGARLPATGQTAPSTRLSVATAGSQPT